MNAPQPKSSKTPSGNDGPGTSSTGNSTSSSVVRRMHPSQTPRWPLPTDLVSRFPSRRSFCERAGISAGRLAQMESGEALLTNIQADRIAAALAVHPSDIWGEWFTLLPAEALDLDGLHRDLRAAFPDTAELVWPMVRRFLDDAVDTLDHIYRPPSIRHDQAA